MAIPLKSADQIKKMKRAGSIVFEAHQEFRKMIRPGITTRQLDTRAREICEKHGAVPAFLNYPSNNRDTIPFPGVICASPNEVIVHGIPNDVCLKEGDIISVDFGCSLDGYFGDSAWTYPVGEISEKAKKLLRVTEQSLLAAIKMCIVGNRIGHISEAVQNTVEKEGFGIVREFVGHGIGQKMHEPPHIPNFGNSSQGRVLKAGMVLAIEPMITEGSYKVKLMEDGWTASTLDDSLAAHFEHTVAITPHGPLVLTGEQF